MNDKEVINKWISGDYKNDEDLKLFISAFGSQLTNISTTYKSLTNNIDDAEYWQLDIIGAILNLERAKIADTDLPYFGYLGSPGAEGYGMAPYLDFSQIDLIPLDDRTYRRALKAKILLNNTDGTMDSAYRLARLVLNTDVKIHDNGDLTFTIEPLSDIDEIATLLISNYDLHVEPQCVQFLGYVGYNKKGLKI